MLSLKEIRPYFPVELQGYERFMVREYLQYKILEIIFGSPFEKKVILFSKYIEQVKLA